MKHRLLPAIIALTVITSCGNSSSEETTATPGTTDATSIPLPAATTTDTAVKTITPTVQQPTTAPVVNQTGQLKTATASTAGLNPAHGQPGHRCDISVGAPLDSKPNQPVVTNTQPQVVTVPQTAPATAQPLVTAPGMNPQHGQPGHRCDIAVGAPLNSKPAQ